MYRISLVCLFVALRAFASDAVNDPPLGRVGGIWFNENVVTTQDPTDGFRVRALAPGVWGRDDKTYTQEGEIIRVSSNTSSGEFRFKRERGALIFEGSYGLDFKYPVRIRLSRAAIDMSWGFYQRHLTADKWPQSPDDCIDFVDQAAGMPMVFDDSLQVCGAVLERETPVIPILIAFLGNGFSRN